MNELNEEEVDQIYEWINGIKITRKSRDLSRDFSDGGTAALHCCCASFALISRPGLSDLDAV